MPTYKNTSDKLIGVQDMSGAHFALEPGEQATTGRHYDSSALLWISDEPYYNRVVDDDVLDLSTEQTVTVSLDTDWVCFLNITDNITVYLQSSTNTPPELRSHTQKDPVIQIPASGRFTKMVVSGAGTCRMVQYKQ